MSEVSAENLRAQSHIARRDVLPIPYSTRVRPWSCCWHPWEEKPALQAPCTAPQGLLLCACCSAPNSVPGCARTPTWLLPGVCETPLRLYLHEWAWCPQGVKGGHISCGHPSDSGPTGSQKWHQNLSKTSLQMQQLSFQQP